MSLEKQKMGEKQPTFDFSKLNFDFASAGSGFNFDASALAGIQSRLNNLIGSDSGYFDSLPKVVKRRVRALRNLDRKYEQIDEEFEKEVKLLEIKYHKEHFAPVLRKRADIINGKYEPTDEEAEQDEEPKITEIKEENDKAVVVKKEKTEEDDKDIVGVPEFWLTALKHHEMIDSIITEKDQDALKYLTDITQEPLEDDSGGSFTLNFHFNENPYFTNEVLSKTYHLEGDEGDEVTCERVDSTAIEWKEGKNITKGVEKGFGPEGSFFNFFSPPNIKEGTPAAAKAVTRMEFDFEIAVAIKEEIVKHAVHWFTGEAGEELAFGGEGGEFDLDGEGEGEDEDEDDGEDGDYVPDGSGAKPECKQQ